MSRGRQHFRETDVTRAIKATVKAGLPVARVEISQDGRIVVVAGAPEQGQDDTPLDEWRARHGKG